MRLIALDFESSGKSPERHAPVTLAVALMEGETVLDSRHWIFAPPKHWKTGQIEREYDVTALQISKVTWNQITRDGQPHAVIVRELREWAIGAGCREDLVIAFNMGFDRAFFDLMLFLASDWHPSIKGVKVPPKPPLLGPWDCAMRRAQDALELENYKLDTVARHFGIERSSDKHDALEDAELAGRIYFRLLAMAKDHAA